MSSEPPITDAELLAYLDEAAPPNRIAHLEAVLRDDGSLRDRLAGLVAGRDAGLHSLGEVWRRRQLTCPTREHLGSYLLGVLPDGLMDYVSFHLEIVECRWCLANVEDLRRQFDASNDGETPRRRGKYFESSVGRLTPGD